MTKNMDYTFTCTAAPVQAEGTIKGKAFYFRSRHGHWTFAVSEDTNTSPIDIQSTEQGFFIEQQYGNKSSNASYLPLDEAKKIIEDCAEMYLMRRLETKNQSNKRPFMML
jgi:hypothetical protein